MENLEVNINLNAITDDLETMNIISQSQGLVSQTTLLANHPFVEDVNAEKVQLEKEEKKKMTQQKTEENKSKKEEAEEVLK